MNYAVIILAFILGGGTALSGGLGMGFICVYIPTLMLFSQVSGIPIAYWPHISPPHAALYGTLLGSLISGKKFPRLRFCLLDGVMVAVLLSTAMGAGVNQNLHLWANVADNQVMEWLLPYFMARLAFLDESARSAGVRVIIICLFVLSFFGLIETRLWPYFLSRNLKVFGLFEGADDMVYHRFGFMRAMLTFPHPIDLGNVALMLVGLIPILALTSELGTKKWYVRLGWLAALFLILIAISFTAYFGLLAMVGMYLLIKRLPAVRRHLALVAILGIAAVAVYTSIVLSEKMPPRPPSSDVFGNSLWIREVIVHRGWAMAKTAGWFGYGKTINTEQLQLVSVDNAYIMMALSYGWMTLGLFLLVPVMLGARLSQALRHARNQMEAEPLIIAAATMAGIMIAMYTVWFGFVYANIYVVLVGFSATLAEFFLEPRSSSVEEIEWESQEDGAAIARFEALEDV